jgi:ankyrin repeat protein
MAVLAKASWFSFFTAALFAFTANDALSQLEKTQLEKTQLLEAFQTAINNADHETVSRVIAAIPAFVHSRFDDDRTCLHLVAEMFLPLCGFGNKTDEYREVLKMLIEAGADPNAVDKNKNPPLFLFANAADLEATKYLLRNGADPLWVNGEKQNVLHQLAQLKNLPGGIVAADANSEQRNQLARLLVAKGVDLNAVDSHSRTPLQIVLANTSGRSYAKWLIENGADVNVADEEGTTALHFVVMQRDCELVSLLLKRRASLRVVSRNYGTPMSLALGDTDPLVAEMLIKRGEVATAFDLAAGGLSYRLTEMLRSTPAVVRSRDSRGATPLHYAAICGRIECLQILLEREATVSAQDVLGNSALHYAVSTQLDVQRGAKLVQLLLAADADPNARNKNAETPLHIATKRGSPNASPVLIDDNVSIVSKLVEGGAKINSIDVNKNTPLHNAARYGMQWTAEELLSANALTTIKNGAGKTPAEVAQENRFDTIAEILTSVDVMRLSERQRYHVQPRRAERDSKAFNRVQIR